MRKIYELDSKDLVAILADRFKVPKDCIELPEDLTDSLIVRIDMSSTLTVGKKASEAPAKEQKKPLASAPKVTTNTGIDYRELEKRAEEETAKVIANEAKVQSEDSKPEPVEVKAEVATTMEVPADGDDVLEEIYKNVTDDYLKQWVKDGNTVAGLVKKLGLTEQHKWRFYDRLRRLQKEDASLPRRYRRTKQTTSED